MNSPTTRQMLVIFFPLSRIVQHTRNELRGHRLFAVGGTDPDRQQHNAAAREPVRELGDRFITEGAIQRPCSASLRTSSSQLNPTSLRTPNKVTLLALECGCLMER